MPNEIILLTGGAEGPYLENILKNLNPKMSVVVVETREGLRRACMSPLPNDQFVRRLIAYCTDIIVPQEFLDHVATPAYNFHPGPPAYPGTCVANFAIYEGAKTFGVCAHEMQASVDSGAIVGVDEFDVPENARFIDLEILAYKQLFQLFARLASALACTDAPLNTIDAEWGPHKTTKADLERMKEFTADMSEDEIRRRWRAFG